MLHARAYAPKGINGWGVVGLWVLAVFGLCVAFQYRQGARAAYEALRQEMEAMAAYDGDFDEAKAVALGEELQAQEAFGRGYEEALVTWRAGFPDKTALLLALQQQERLAQAQAAELGINWKQSSLSDFRRLLKASAGEDWSRLCAAPYIYQAALRAVLAARPVALQKIKWGRDTLCFQLVGNTAVLKAFLANFAQEAGPVWVESLEIRPLGGKKSMKEVEASWVERRMTIVLKWELES